MSIASARGSSTTSEELWSAENTEFASPVRSSPHFSSSSPQSPRPNENVKKTRLPPTSHAWRRQSLLHEEALAAVRASRAAAASVVQGDIGNTGEQNSKEKPIGPGSSSVSTQLLGARSTLRRMRHRGHRVMNPVVGVGPSRTPLTKEVLERYTELLTPSRAKSPEDVHHDDEEEENAFQFVSLAVEGKEEVAVGGFEDHFVPIHENEEEHDGRDIGAQLGASHNIPSMKDDLAEKRAMDRDKRCAQWIAECYSPNTLVHLSDPVGAVHTSDDDEKELSNNRLKPPPLSLNIVKTNLSANHSPQNRSSRRSSVTSSPPRPSPRPGSTPIGAQQADPQRPLTLSESQLLHEVRQVQAFAARQRHVTATLMIVCAGSLSLTATHQEALEELKKEDEAALRAAEQNAQRGIPRVSIDPVMEGEGETSIRRARQGTHIFDESMVSANCDLSGNELLSLSSSGENIAEGADSDLESLNSGTAHDIRKSPAISSVIGLIRDQTIPAPPIPGQRLAARAEQRQQRKTNKLANTVPRPPVPPRRKRSSKQRVKSRKQSIVEAEHPPSTLEVVSPKKEERRSSEAVLHDLISKTMPRTPQQEYNREECSNTNLQPAPPSQPVPPLATFHRMPSTTTVDEESLERTDSLLRRAGTVSASTLNLLQESIRLNETLGSNEDGTAKTRRDALVDALQAVQRDRIDRNYALTLQARSNLRAQSSRYADVLPPTTVDQNAVVGTPSHSEAVGEIMWKNSIDAPTLETLSALHRAIGDACKKHNFPVPEHFVDMLDGGIMVEPVRLLEMDGFIVDMSTFFFAREKPVLELLQWCKKLDTEMIDRIKTVVNPRSIPALKHLISTWRTDIIRRIRLAEGLTEDELNNVTDNILSFDISVDAGASSKSPTFASTNNVELEEKGQTSQNTQKDDISVAKEEQEVEIATRFVLKEKVPQELHDSLADACCNIEVCTQRLVAVLDRNVWLQAQVRLLEVQEQQCLKAKARVEKNPSRPDEEGVYCMNMLGIVEEELHRLRAELDANTFSVESLKSIVFGCAEIVGTFNRHAMLRNMELRKLAEKELRQQLYAYRAAFTLVTGMMDGKISARENERAFTTLVQWEQLESVLTLVKKGRSLLSKYRSKLKYLSNVRLVSEVHRLSSADETTWKLPFPPTAKDKEETVSPTFEFVSSARDDTRIEELQSYVVMPSDIFVTLLEKAKCDTHSPSSSEVINILSEAHGINSTTRGSIPTPPLLLPEEATSQDWGQTEDDVWKRHWILFESSHNKPGSANRRASTSLISGEGEGSLRRGSMSVIRRQSSSDTISPKESFAGLNRKLSQGVLSKKGSVRSVLSGTRRRSMDFSAAGSELVLPEDLQVDSPPPPPAQGKPPLTNFLSSPKSGGVSFVEIPSLPLSTQCKSSSTETATSPLLKPKPPPDVILRRFVNLTPLYMQHQRVADEQRAQEMKKRRDAQQRPPRWQHKSVRPWWHKPAPLKDTDERHDSSTAALSGGLWSTPGFMGHTANNEDVISKHHDVRTGVTPRVWSASTRR